MKFEKLDAVCILLGLFMLAAYIKIGTLVFLATGVILILPVLFFMFKGGVKLKVVDDKNHEHHAEKK